MSSGPILEYLRECYLMNLVGVCTSSMSPVVDVNDLVIRD